jgi:hypothetical protein
MVKEGATAMNTEGSETLCGACRTIPVSHLALDVPEPLEGWAELFRKRGIEVVNDHLGRPSVPRYVLGDLIDEQRDREAELAQRPRPEAAPVGAGIPAREGLSAYESLLSAGRVTPAEEFGAFPKPRFLEEQLEQGRRHEAARREENRRRKEKRQ